MLKNWRTSLFGIGALITAVAQILKGDTTNGIASIIAAFGLFAAKDANNGLSK